MLATVQLRAMGGRVEEADSVSDALDLIRTVGPFAMIVADRRLAGGTSGVEVLRKAGGAHEPFLYLMTAHVDGKVLEEAHAVGAIPVDKLDLAPLLDCWQQVLTNGDRALPPGH